MESKQWKPSSSTEGAIQLRVRRVYRHALRSLEDIIGPHKARIVYAEFKAHFFFPPPPPPPPPPLSIYI